MAELTADEFFGGVAAPPQDHHVVPPEVQTQRDAEGASLRQANIGEPASAASKQADLDEITRELPKAPNAEARAALEQEKTRLAARASSKLLSADEFFGAKDTPHEPRSEADIALGGVGAGAKAIAREAAGIGDMLLSIPGGAAGTIGEFGLRVALSANPDISQAAAAKTGREFREYVSGESSPTWFTDIVNHFSSSGDGADDPTAVGKAMSWVEGKIDKADEKIESISGGTFLKDDASMFIHGVMNLLGLQGGLKSGRALTDKLKDKFGKKEEAVQEPVASPTEPPREDPNTGPVYTTNSKGVTSTGTETPQSMAEAHVAEANGITDPKTFGKTQRMRWKQVREAFPDDADWNQYLRHYTGEEARIAAQGDLRGRTYPGPRSGALMTPEEFEGPPERPATQSDIAAGVRQSSLDRAKTKLSQPWSMTSEERIAWAKAEGPKLERGAADNQLLAAMALGGVGLALAVAYPDAATDVAEATFLAGAMSHGKINEIHATAPISTVLDASHNTLKTLERLNEVAPGKFLFKKTEVEQHLRRPDVSKAERDVLEDVLTTHEGPTITAKELVKGFQERVGNFDLRIKESDEHADFGLDKIGRVIKESDGWMPEGLTIEQERQELSRIEQQRAGANNAVTHIYQLPEHMKMGDSSSEHFDDPRYFAHTRVFKEGGVRHVVEIQSDLVQNLGRALTVEERAVLEAELEGVTKKLNEALAAYREGTAGPMESRTLLQPLRIQEAELRAKLKEKQTGAAIQPILKNWDRRLVREELADASRKGEKVVRFATADTVAKVEGWPELVTPERNAVLVAERDIGVMLRNRQSGGIVLQSAVDSAQSKLPALRAAADKADAARTQRFYDRYQGIYNRYKGDTEKFLRGLGGVEKTDGHGHTWVDVPTLPGAGKRAQMFGRADTKALIGIAAVAFGGVLGANLDPSNPIEGAVLGVLGGAGLASGQVGRAVRAIREGLKTDTRIRINDLTERRVHREGQMARATWQVSEKIIKLLPRQKDRVAIHLAMDEGRVDQLKGKQLEAAKIAQQYYAETGALALGAGVLKKVIEDYTTHLWDITGKNGQAIKGLLSTKGPGMSPNSKFSLNRAHLTMAEGKKAGLVPRTEDLAAVVGMYGSSMGRAIANRTFLNELKGARGPEGIKLVAKMAKAPDGYVTIASPYLQGMVVHPDIAPSLKFMFEAQDPAQVMAAALAVNTALKRVAVAYSFFHGKSLFDAALGALRSPVTAVKVLAQSAAPRVFGQNRYIKMAYEGGAGDAVDFALASGLKIGYERSAPVSEDVGGNFYQAFTGAQKMLDEAVPKLGKATIGPALAVSHVIDNFTWGRIHTGMKLEVFMAKFEALMENSAKAGKPLTKEQAGDIAATYANYIFGGLNWQRIAEGAKSRWGREVALAMLAPSGRRAMQLLLFAPDWLISTTMSLVKAIPSGKDLMRPDKLVSGLWSAKTLGDLHRQQVIRSAFYYAMIGDAINYYNTGHHLWGKEQKDWTRVELGDGRSMQLSKHFTDPFVLANHFGQEARNKMGVIPSEVLEQFSNQQYLSTKGSPPIVPKGDENTMAEVRDRAAHLAKRLNPIGVQQFRDGGAAAGVSGMLGVPILGKTEEQKRTERLQKALEDYHRFVDQAGQKK